MTNAAHAQEGSARPPSLMLQLTEGPRAFVDLVSFYAMRPYLSTLPRGDGHGVLVLPGFLAGDMSTAPMRNLLTQLGYLVSGWNLGRNIKIDDARVEAMQACVNDLFKRSGGKISIVGWSLGGVFARELAKLMPEKVRQVISLGSPISDDRNHSNARVLFEMLNTKEPEPFRNGQFRDLHEAPPVPTTSILTKADGVVHWRGSVQQPGKQTENIHVWASHCGLGVSPPAMIAIADRLAQPEDEWSPFEPTTATAMMFPSEELH